MSLRSPYAVHWHPEGASSTLLTGITSMSLEMGTSESRQVTAGRVFPGHLMIPSQRPRFRFTTLNLKVWLDVAGLTGGLITSTLNPGVELFAVQLDNNGQPQSGSVHDKYTINKGILVPQSLTVSSGEPAALEYLLLPIHDGTNDIVVTQASQALTGTWADPERFTLGPMTIGSQTVEKKLSFRLDFGLSVDSISLDSETWDQFLDFDSAQPTITITGKNASQFASGTFPLAGREGTHANTTLYLRKYLQTAAGFVVDATAQHLKMTADGIAFWENLFDAQNNRSGDSTLRMPLKWDGTNDPVTINTASAIT